MTIKIYKRWEHPIFISKEEYAKMHAESDYADYHYDIVKEEDD